MDRRVGGNFMRGWVGVWVVMNGDGDGDGDDGLGKRERKQASEWEDSPN